MTSAGSADGQRKSTNNGVRSGFLGKTGTDEAPLDKTYYNTLNVSPTASAAEIKRAYYTLSLQYHPDRTQNLDDFTRREYAERFKLISQAYSILSDPEKRTLYNRYGKDERLASNDASGVSFEDFDTEEFFRFMFGGEEFISIVGDFELAKTFKHTLNDLLKDAEQTDEQREEQRLNDLLHSAERASAREERIRQLSVNLITKLSMFTDVFLPDGPNIPHAQALNHFVEIIRMELPGLLQAPFGQQLLHSIGYIYSFKARFWLGKMDSQEGHLGKRIMGFSRRVHSSWKDHAHLVKETVKTVKCAVQWGQSMSKLSQIADDDTDDSQQPFSHHSGHLEYSGVTPSEPGVAAASAPPATSKQQRKSSTQPVVPLTDEEKRRLEADTVAKSMETLWHVVKLEVESVERDVCDRVLNDPLCARDILRYRCVALAELGQLWRQASPSNLP